MGTGQAAVAVESRMFRALAVLRVVVLANTVAWTIYRHSFERVALGWTCIGVMVAWTVVSIWVYAAPVRRTPAVVAVDLGIAMAVLLATPIVKGADFSATLPGFWINGAVLACAIRFGWIGGGVAGGMLGVTDILLRAHPGSNDWSHLFLILLAGTMVGFLCQSLQEMAAERDQAQRESAAAAERARLARVVHDGVLQVLALVQRRGAELGGDAAELGRLAGEQEQALRSLIRSQDAVSSRSVTGTADLAAALGSFDARPGVEVAVPAGTVDLPAATVAELTAVVGACLDNVTRHVGEGAAAWVLLDDLGDRVELSVRDDGPGIPDGRLAEAEADGRLGVRESIRGRVRDLGGTATLVTGPTGTEWEIVVPKPFGVPVRSGTK
jgi:signal transduction histidine kinase